MKVSVSMITYNHEKFISQAVESILMQKVSFDYEIVIGEDCSTDNTRQILLNYQKKYPDKIHLLLPEKNLGAQENSRNTLQACRGQYIAALEGDDYWTDPLKLQKQVDFLEANPEYSGAFHQIQVLEEDGTWGDPLMWWQDLGERLDITFEDTISTTPPFHTSSFLFRRDRLSLPKDFSRYASGDMALYMLLSSQGKLRRIPENMSIHRKHPGGITKTTSHGLGLIAHINRLYLFTSLRTYFFPKGYQRYNLVIKDYDNRIVEYIAKDLDITTFWDNLAILNTKASFIVSLRILVKLGLFVISRSLKNINLTLIVFCFKRLIPTRLKNLMRSSMRSPLIRNFKHKE